MQRFEWVWPSPSWGGSPPPGASSETAIAPSSRKAADSDVGHPPERYRCPMLAFMIIPRPSSPRSSLPGRSWSYQISEKSLISVGKGRVRWTRGSAALPPVSG